MRYGEFLPVPLAPRLELRGPPGMDLPDAMPIPNGMMCEREFSRATFTVATGPTPVTRPWGIFGEAFEEREAPPSIHNDTAEEARWPADVSSSISTEPETSEDDDVEIYAV